MDILEKRRYDILKKPSILPLEFYNNETELEFYAEDEAPILAIKSRNHITVLCSDSAQWITTNCSCGLKPFNNNIKYHLSIELFKPEAGKG